MSPCGRQAAARWRNGLFAGSLACGERAAELYAVIETVKANRIEPRSCVADVLVKLAGGWPTAQ